MTDQTLIETLNRTVPEEWADYNGHMNEGWYSHVFSDAADAVMQLVGADAEYIAAGKSFFTVEILIKYLAETHIGEPFVVHSQVLEGAGKKLRLLHLMKSAKDDRLLATGNQLLLHVDLTTRRTALPEGMVAEKMAAYANAHKDLPIPE